MTELEKLRHSCAHVMAAAVCRLYPDVKLDIGPPTDEGFYYDFDLPHRLSTDDFEAIEKMMQQIIEEDHPFTSQEVTREEATSMLEGQPYKLERLADIPADEKITFFTCGEFTDLCRGPHVESTGAIKAHQLVNVAGSYYRGKGDPAYASAALRNCIFATQRATLIPKTVGRSKKTRSSPTS